MSKVGSALEQLSVDLITFAGMRSDFPPKRTKNSNVENLHKFVEQSLEK